ncbi:MAG: DUF2341 domain-containing protein [Candidatus Omnitrophica bacterium]|nr:DUF2341 domain-containing protein [Candidatus Omnitrophota bacterium]MCB9720262.1 DUF2341 domain-containing protein [Candidatus Omnitrophota bacterium]
MANRRRQFNVRAALITLFVCVMGMVCPRTAFTVAPWFDSNWNYRKQITVDETKVPSDLTDFPMLINLSADSDLAGHAQADGDDILFTASDGTTQLDHEIERYDAGTGALVAWVEVPLLTSTTGTIVYMYYGNGAAANQENVAGTWSSTYQGVWHMAEDPSIDTDGDCGGGTSEECDSTNNNLDGESFGSMTNTDLVTGQINGALELDGNDDYIGVADSGTLDITDDLSLSVWIRPELQAAGGAGSIAVMAVEQRVFGDKQGTMPEMVHVAGEIYAIAYAGNGNDGFLTTIRVADDGTITASEIIDTLEFDAIQGLNPEIIPVSGNIYAVAYQGQDNDGFLISVSISGAGVISAVIDSIEFAPVDGVTPKIVELSTGVFAIAVNGGAQDDDLFTVTINGAGAISSSPVDEMVFGDITAFEPEIIHIAGDIYAVVFRGSGNDGYVSTIEIGADGTIQSGIIIDSLEFDTFYAEDPEIIRINGNIYAIAYEGDGNDGFVTTVEIDSNGQITDTILDTFEFDSTGADNAQIVNVTGNVYAIAYDAGTGGNDFATITIANDGNIGPTVLDRLVFGDVQANEAEIINISGDIYAVVYRGAASDGYVTTVDISATGSIDAGVILDVLEFDTDNALNPEIIPVSGDIYAIVYRGSGNDGFIVTVDIDAAGNIENAVVDSAEIVTTDINYPSIVHISGDIYAVVYTDLDNDGVVITVDIAADGTITTPVIDSFEFDTVSGLYPRIIQVSGDVYAIVYAGSGNDGFIVTLDIDTDGTINTPVIDSFEYDTSAGIFPDIQNITGDIFGIVYRGAGNDGFAVTLDIDTDGTINTPVIDSLEFDTTFANTPKLINVTGTLYATAYEDSTGDGQVLTFTISNAGAISAVIDSFEYAVANGDAPDLIQVSGTMFAVAYTSQGVAKLSTFTVSNTGTFTGSLVDQGGFGFGAEHNDADPKLVRLASDMVAVVYAGVGNDGTIKTIQINSSGVITDGWFDYFEYDTAQGDDPDIINLSGSDYAIVYENGSSVGQVATLDINSDGTIPKVINDTLVLNATATVFPKIINVTGTLYAAVYEDVDNDGVIQTFTISAAGAISGSVLDTLEYEVADGDTPDLLAIDSDTVAIPYAKAGVARLATVDIDGSGMMASAVTDISDFGYGSVHIDATPELIPISGEYYAVIYGGTSSDGMIKTIRLDSSGNVVDGFVDFFEYATAQGLDPSAVHVSGDIYAITYRGPGNDGFVATVDISVTGTIQQAVVDEWEFSTTDIITPKMINISGTTYAIVYEDENGDGQLVTLSISNAGAITTTLIDSFEFDVIDGETPEIIPISGDIYAIAYDRGQFSQMKTVEISAAGAITEPAVDRGDYGAGGIHTDTGPALFHLTGDIWGILYTGVGGDGKIKTMEIDAAGTVVDGFRDGFEFDDVNGNQFDLTAVSGDIYAVAYRGAANDGFLVTLDISTTGTIAQAVVDSWEFSTVDVQTPRILKISGTTYAMVYENSAGAGQLVTLTIANDGSITTSFIDTLTFDASVGDTPAIMNVSGDIYAIAYSGVGTDGFLVTVDIDAAGNITPVIDTLEFDATEAQTPELVSITGTMVAVAYDGPGNDGFVSTIGIDAAGNIDATVTDTLEFDTGQGETPEIRYLGSDIYVIAYSGPADDGFLVTVSIASDGNIGPAVLDSLEFDDQNALTPSIRTLGDSKVIIAYDGVDGVTGYDLQIIDVLSDANRGIYKGNAYQIDGTSGTIYATINTTTITGTSTVSGADWEYVVLTYDRDAGSDQLKLYLSGSLAMATGLTDFINTNSGSFNIGEAFFGGVDEVRIADGAVLSADWIATEFANQNDPDTFYTLGPERVEGIKTWGDGTNVPPTGFWNVGANWTGDTVPTGVDLVNFDDTAVTDCVVDVTVGIAGLDINTGYTGTITQGSNVITIGTFGFNQADGTFAGGDADIDVNGAFILNTGTFTATSGTLAVAEDFTILTNGTFADNAGTVVIEGSIDISVTTNGATFHHLTFNKVTGPAATVTLEDGFTVRRFLTVDKADADNFVITPNGTLTITAQGSFAMANASGSGNLTFGTSDVLLDLSGTLDQDIIQTAGTFAAAFENDRTTGVTMLQSAFTTVGSGADCTLVEGVFALNGFDFTCGGGFTVEDGVTLRLDGTETVSTPVISPASTVEYVGTTALGVLQTWDYDFLVINGAGGTVTQQADVTVAADVSISAGTLDVNGYELAVAGSVDIDAALDASPGSGGDSRIFVGADWDATGGTFTQTDSTVMFMTTTAAGITSAGETFDNIVINDGLIGYWKFDDTATSSADSSGYGHTGSWSGNPTPSTDRPLLKMRNRYSLDFNGSTDFINAGDQDIYRGLDELTLSVWVKQSATGPNQAVIGHWGNTTPRDSRKFLIRINDGDIQGFVFTTEPAQEGGTFSTTDLTDDWHHLALTWDGSTLRMYIDGAVSGTTFSGSGALNDTSQNNFYIGNDEGGSGTFFNGLLDDVRVYNRALTAVEIGRLAEGRHPLTSLGTVTLQDPLDVDGTLFLNAGALDTGSDRAITVATGWENNGGVFLANTGTVTFDGGDQVIPGSETFYNFEMSVTSTGTLTFGKRSVTATTGTLTLQGAAGNLLALRSSEDAIRSEINPAGARVIGFLNVQDNSNISGTVIDCTNNCTDSGNNIEWDFGGGINTLSGTLYSDEGITPLTSTDMAVSIDGDTAILTATSNAVTGTFLINYTASSITAGDILTFYIDGETEKGVTVTISDGNSLAGIPIYQNYLIVRSENGPSLTTNDLDVANNSGDTDIAAIYTMTGSLLFMEPGTELFIPIGETLAPDATIRVHDIDINGTLSMNSLTVFVDGSWDASSGTYNQSAAGVVFTGTGTESITSASQSFYDMYFNNGLMAYWRFEESSSPAVDSSGRGNHGVWNSDTASSTDVPALNFTNDRSIEFFGDDDYVDIIDSQVAGRDFKNIGSNNDYTLAAWIQTTGGTGSGTTWTVNAVVVELGSEGASATRVPFSFGIDSNFVALGRTANYTTSDEIEVGSVAVNDGAWHHIAAVVMGDTVDFYVDGTFDVSRTFTVATGDVSTNNRTVNMQIGVGATNFGVKNLSDFNGLIDDVRIYARAISATEVRMLADGYHDGNNLGMWSLNDDLDINNNFTLFDGAVSAGTRDITIAGDWQNFGGQFSPGTGRVTFDGTAQSIPASSTFYQFDKTVAATDILTFGEGSTLVVTGSVRMQGASGNLLLLRSSDSGTRWRITPPVTKPISFVNVQDSFNTSPSDINPANSVDNGNNVRWFPARTGPLKGAIIFVD